MLPDKLPPGLKTLLEQLTPWKNIKFERYDGGGVVHTGNDERKPAELYKDAQVVSSALADHPFSLDASHAICLDIDRDAYLIPSSTPGHSHLYVALSVPWAKYEKFLEACVEVGLIERNYYEVSKKNKGTFLRLPWVKKGGEAFPTLETIEEFLNDDKLDN